MSRVFVARHAVAAAPDDLRLPGGDDPLRPEGERQARALAARLRDEAPAAVYASEARRARQTAAEIARICGAPLTIVPELRELGFGAWSGRTYAAVVAEDPAAAAYFVDPEAMTPPGGEAAAGAARRVLEMLATIGSGAGGVVVGHTGSLRLALALTLGMPLAASWRLRLDCAHLSVLDWTSDGPLIRVLNDGCHLPAGAPAVAPA